MECFQKYEWDSFILIFFTLWDNISEAKTLAFDGTNLAHLLKNVMLLLLRLDGEGEGGV